MTGIGLALFLAVIPASSALGRRFRVSMIPTAGASFEEGSGRLQFSNCLSQVLM